ncbi:ABC transporter substrate-binding protein [Pseudooceanicola algae]|uniref:Leucine-, isoleucine-, valine-, threonine-, and alanine-binding protein n=1 Tax=Pseudooceanicola algae TaxID=1537215 RepID=A0A418SJ14_9RHOB|nr:ABC transporter substrate-binding protein [Pseudooceanicola algae]QPM91993.1 Leucine-, isoleucine-, valine-, threonine-, and alanine-binding protein [Pseudooceanicola algae]
MTTTTRKILTAGILSAALASGAASLASAQEVTIGVIGPMTGPAANTGAAHRQGMELAVKEWNAGMVETVSDTPPTATLVFEDSNSKPEVGISAAQRLMTQDSVDMIIGDTLHSHVTMALMEMAPQYGVPILSAEPVSSAIADKVLSDPERYEYYWKGNYNSDGYGQAVHGFYKWAFENDVIEEGNKQIAFVVEDTDYGLANAEQIGKLFEEDGWEVIATETTPTGTTDFYPQLSKLRGLDPDVLISVFTLANSGTSFVRQLDEQALEASHLAIFYPTRPEFMEVAPEIADGLIWAALQFSPEITPAHQEFSDRIEAEFDTPANYSHAHAYCTMLVALRAVDAAGSTEAAAISEEIGKTDYECLIGRMQFGEDHTVRSGADAIPVPVAQMQDGQNQVIWPENVATADAK